MMTKNVETEITIYAKIGDYDGFDQATGTEIHAQYEYKLPEDGNGPRGRMRVRATTVDGVTLYSLTTKTPQGADSSVHTNTETTTEISEEFYEAWLALFQPKGVNKLRYTYISKSVELTTPAGVTTIPQIKYEVDVFLDKEGNKSKWCKIDIELDHLLDYLNDQHPDIDKVNTTVKVTDLPFKPEHCFLGSSEKPEHQEAIKHFWETFSYPPVQKEVSVS